MKYIHIFFRIIDIVAVVVIGSLLLLGCKAKQIDWAFECSQKFPTKTVYIPGKDTTLWDTIHEAGLIIQSDPIIRFKKCPDNLIIKGRTVRVDTLKIENTAQISLLERTNKETEDRLHDSQDQTLNALKIVDEERASRKRSATQRNFIAIGMVLLIGWNFRKTIFTLLKL